MFLNQKSVSSGLVLPVQVLSWSKTLLLERLMVPGSNPRRIWCIGGNIQFTEYLLVGAFNVWLARNI